MSDKELKLLLYLEEAKRHIERLKKEGVEHGSLWIVEAQVNLAITAWNTREERPNLTLQKAIDKISDLRSRLTAAEQELKQLRGGTCICMDCGKVIKTTEQSKHCKECKGK